MAVPTKEVKSRTYYHGTCADEQKIKSIIKNGILPNMPTHYFEDAKPVKNMVYITPDLNLAIDYASDPCLENSYIIVINGNDLLNIYADEDSIAYFIWDHKIKYERHGNIPWWYRKEKTIKLEAPNWLIRLAKEKKVYDASPEKFSIAKLGKFLSKFLTSEQHLELISLGANIANKGKIKAKEIWKIPNEDFEVKDFFRVAERIA